MLMLELERNEILPPPLFQYSIDIFIGRSQPNKMSLCLYKTKGDDDDEDEIHIFHVEVG